MNPPKHKQHLLQLTPQQWRDWFDFHHEPSYRADQVLDWIYGKMVTDPAGMTNLAKETRRLLLEGFDWHLPEVRQTVSSGDGTTSRFAFELKDGCIIESVLMDQDGRYGFCISSQAGCGLDCRFCATARMGFSRNLTLPEILGQIVHLAGRCGTMGNIVFMGMGEPLLNMEALLPALDAITDTERLALGRRRVTVSTAGVTAGIRKLAAHHSRPNLALSLNSPWEEQRSELMPINRSNPLNEVLDACLHYRERTGRGLMLEYVMLGGVNTSLEAARSVADMAKRLEATVNLIAFNPCCDVEYESPDRDEIAGFRRVLEKRGIPVTQRYRRGTEIAAGCGQLRAGGYLRNSG